MSWIADPRILLRHEIDRAMAEATAAIETHHRGEMIAEAHLAGSNRSFENAFAIIAAVRAVELYKGSKYRGVTLRMHRASQRTAGRRLRKPPTRKPRRSDEWEGSPAIPALSAEELSTKHADELLSLMWLAYFYLETKQPFDRRALQFFEPSLPLLYRKPTNFARVQDNLRKRMKAWQDRAPASEIGAYYKVDTTLPGATQRIALAVFQKWKGGLNELRFGSGRAKSKRIGV